MPRDMKDMLSPATTLAPAARTASANGTAIDRQGFDGVSLLVGFGAYTDGTHTPSLQESADGSTWTNSAAADILGSFVAVSAAAGANTTQQVSYIGLGRYVRLVMTVSGATTGAVSHGLAIRGFASQQPVT